MSILINTVIFKKINVGLFNRFSKKYMPWTQSFSESSFAIWPNQFKFSIQDYKLYLTRTIENSSALNEEPVFLTSEHVDVKVNPYSLALGRLSINETVFKDNKIVLPSKSELFLAINDWKAQVNTKNYSKLNIKKLSFMNTLLDLGEYSISASPMKIDFHIENVANKAIADTVISVNAFDSGEQKMLVIGRVGPLHMNHNVMNTPVEMNIHLSDVPALDYIHNLIQHYPIDVSQSTMSADLKVSGSLSSGLTIAGDMSVKNFYFDDENRQHQVALNAYIDLGPSFLMSYNDDMYSFKDVNININNQVIQARGRIQNLKNSPKWKIAFRSQDMDIQEAISLGPFHYNLFTNDLDVTGPISFDVTSQGDAVSNRFYGTFFLDDMRLRYQDLISKKSGDAFLYRFNGVLDNKTNDLTINSKVVMKNGQVQWRKLTKGGEWLSQCGEIHQQYRVYPARIIRFNSLNGNVQIKASLDEFNGAGLPNVGMYLTDLKSESVNLFNNMETDIFLSGKITPLQNIMTLNGKFDVRGALSANLNRATRLPVSLPFRLNGHIDYPNITCLQPDQKLAAVL